MKEIKLTRNKVALVDDEDFEKLNQYKWHVVYNKNTEAFYAKNRKFYMHRFIMSAPDNLFVDHINHNGLDNRKENLRLATISQNGMNRRLNKNSTSGHIGVSFSKVSQKWEATIKINKATKHLGFFEKIEDAIIARKKAAIDIFQEFFNSGA